ncbi:hypothetical protein ACFXTN_023331 [Malus domestica]
MIECNLIQGVMDVGRNLNIAFKKSGELHACIDFRNYNTWKDDTKEESQDVCHITIQESKEDEIPEEDVTAAQPQLKDGGQSTVDDLNELNFGTKDEQKPIFVSALLSGDEVDEYYQLLSEYKDVFAWTYKEMPGLDPVIAVHHLAVKRGMRPIKQTQRRYRSELIP